MRVILAALIVLISISFGWSHEHDRPDLDAWFSHLMDKDGKSCCNGKDDRPLESIWSTEGENGHQHYKVKIEGQWVDVPDEAVIEKPNRYGSALVWYWPDFLLGQDEPPKFHIRCFLPGTLS